MSNDKLAPKDEKEEQLLEEIYRKFSLKQEQGNPPLESQPPSQRLVPHSPLNEQESNVIFWADCRWYGLREVPPDHPIYKQGWTISFVPRSKKNPQSAPQEPKPVKNQDDTKGGTTT